MRKLAPEFPNNLGHLLTPNNGNSIGTLLTTGLVWAADNSAFSGFNSDRFLIFLKKITSHPRCLFVVCPDVVADSVKTLQLYKQWVEIVRSTRHPVAFVLQDGQENYELPNADAYFIGGSTEFKLSRTVRDICRECRAKNAWLHMGRVNSLKRIRWANTLCCNSIDGTSTSMFGDRYIRQYVEYIRSIATNTVPPFPKLTLSLFD